MYYKSTKYKTISLFIALILCGIFAYAQEEKGARPAIDSSMALSPDYLPTRHAAFPTFQYYPIRYTEIDTTMYGIASYDPLWKIQNLYQSLGINGQAHENMVFVEDHPIGFTMITLPYPLYFKRIQDLDIYDVKTSFTNIDFTYGILNEYDFEATHAQHVRGADFVFNLDGASNAGYFIHQGINRLSLSLSARYETPNRRYGFLAAYVFNHAKFSENGGLQLSNDFTDRNPRDTTITYDLSSFPVMFSNGQTLINTHAGQLTNYLNIHSKKGNYYGTLSHTLDINYTDNHFTDYDLNNLFYVNRYYMSTDTTNDSLRCFSVANTLQWANFSPVDTVGDQPYFIRFAGGVRHEYVHATQPFCSDNSVTVFARATARLFRVWELYGHFAYSFFGYTQNDAQARVGARFIINQKHSNYLDLEASFYRYSPDYIFSHYSGNNNLWDKEWKKQNTFKAGIHWSLYGYSLGFNFYNLGRHVFLDNQFEPMQLEKAVQVLQLQLLAPVRTKHFGIDAQMALQHSTNKAVTVPLFAGKLGAAYTTRIFKKRLRFQVGIDLFYNTPYFADGYNPIIHQFYSQQFSSVGNYLYLNAHIAMRVKRISFYVRGGNLIAGLMSFRYITTPGYPMQGRNFEVGVNWKFYD